MWVDSHCHLDFPDFGPELADVVRRAETAGVGWMMTIGTRLDRFPGVLRVAERFESVVCTVGVHPHEAGHAPTPSTDELIGLARHPRVVGFGETGLDYYYERSPREAQKTSFRAHIAAARAANLPVIVHARDADEDIIAILREEAQRGPFPGLIHCFTSGPALAEAALECGLFISFSGIVTFKNAGALREIARWVPAERILVETDAPYLAPAPHRGRRNEPAFVALTAERLAAERGETPEAFARATSGNYFRLFAKAAALRPATAAALGANIP